MGKRLGLFARGFWGSRTVAKAMNAIEDHVSSQLRHMKKSLGQTLFDPITSVRGFFEISGDKKLLEVEDWHLVAKVADDV